MKDSIKPGWHRRICKIRLTRDGVSMLRTKYRQTLVMVSEVELEDIHAELILRERVKQPIRDVGHMNESLKQLIDIFCTIEGIGDLILKDSGLVGLELS